MARQLQMVAGKDALVALLKARLPQSYGVDVDVQESGPKDFNNSGELVLQKIAVRVRMGDAAFGDARDTSLTTLSATLRYLVVCRHESLRSSNEQRDRTLDLAACVCEELAGTRLVLADGSRVGPILIKSVAGVEDVGGPVADCWGVSVEISGFAQFDGRNAQPQTGVTA